MSPNEAAFARIADAAGSAPWALVGAFAARRWGADVQPGEPLQVLAAQAPATTTDAPTTERGMQFWDLPGEVAVRWWTPLPHHAAFVEQALARTTAARPPTLGAEDLIALWMIQRAQAALAVALLAGGAVDVPSQRAFIGRWLGPYAVDDFDLLLQEAEWALMKQRHTDGGASLH